MSVFDDVKELVPIADAVSFYGFTPNRSGFICCPFHNEKTPSLKLYDRSYHCFGCGSGGSVIDFVSNLFNLDALGAVKRLNEDFKLSLSLDSPPDSERIRERQKITDAWKLYEEWRDQMINQLNAVFRVAELADYEHLTESEVTAIKYQETVEYWSDTLSYGSIDEQMQIFRDREGVERICKMVLKNMPKKLAIA